MSYYCEYCKNIIPPRLLDDEKPSPYPANCAYPQQNLHCISLNVYIMYRMSGGGLTTRVMHSERMLPSLFAKGSGSAASAAITSGGGNPGGGGPAPSADIVGRIAWREKSIRSCKIDMSYEDTIDGEKILHGNDGLVGLKGGRNESAMPCCTKVSTIIRALLFQRSLHPQGFKRSYLDNLRHGVSGKVSTTQGHSNIWCGPWTNFEPIRSTP